MPDLASLPVDFALYDTVKHGNAQLRNVKSRIGATWTHSIRSVGGFWLATAEYDDTPAAQREMFLNGLMRGVRATVGGVIIWQGFISQMDLTVGGQTYTRRWADLANRVQAIYSRLGDNLFTNGSVESGSWAAYNTPTTLAQSATWISDGANSQWIIGDSLGDGAVIQTGITIVASKAYDCQVSVKIISGTWKLEIYRTDTGATLGSGTENNTGQRTMRASIADTNTYAGPIGVRLYITSAAGEIYADGATFRESALQARTSWLADTRSQSEFGTIETALLLPGMSDDAAGAQAATYLAEQAWPRTIPPDQFGAGALGGPDGLKLTFAGYVFTLRNKYTARGGTTQAASTHAANAVLDSEFIAAGPIAANAFLWQIDDRAPLRVWDVLRDLTVAGDAAGARWTCGVYGGRLFSYQPASTTIDYHFQKGKFLSSAFSRVDPWAVRPGLVYLDEMPAGPGAPTPKIADDPHVVYLDEIEFSAADWLAGGQGVTGRAQVSA